MPKKRNGVDDEFLRKRAERQRKLRKRRLTAFFVFFIIAALCVGAVLSVTVFFKIENVKISGSAIYTEKEIKKASGIGNGDNLFAVSKSSTENRIKSKLPYVEKISFKRELPATLIIKVTDAEEFSAYESGGEYYIVSESGWVLKKSDDAPENLCTVLGADVKCKVGNGIVYNNSEQKKLIAEIADVTAANAVVLNSVDISDAVNIKIRVENRFDVELGTLNFLEEKIKHLAAMIKNIGEQKGRINLSMWSNSKSQGTFIPTG